MSAPLTPADKYARTPGQVQATIKRAKAKRERKALRNIRNEKRATRGAVAARYALEHPTKRRLITRMREGLASK